MEGLPRLAGAERVRAGVPGRRRGWKRGKRAKGGKQAARTSARAAAERLGKKEKRGRQWLANSRRAGVKCRG